MRRLIYTVARTPGPKRLLTPIWALQRRSANMGAMGGPLVAIIVGVCFSALLTPAVRNIARGRGLLEEVLPARKIHGRAVPRLGGVAIVLSFYLALACAAPFSGE